MKLRALGALSLAVLCCNSAAVAAKAPRIAFTPPAGWIAMPVPPPKDDGTVTLHKWQTPDGLQKLYVDIMPWKESLGSFFAMTRGEIEGAIARYQRTDDTHFVLDSKHCLNRF